MFSSRSIKSRIGLWTIAAVVFAGSSIVALPAQAAWNAPSSLSFIRNATAGALTIKDNESVTVSSQHTISPEYPGWPFKRGSVLSRTALQVNAGSGLTVEEGSQWRSWSGWDSEYTAECDIRGENAKFTITSAMSCMDSLNVYDNAEVTNDSGSTKNITTNLSSQVLKNGKKTMSGTGIEKSLYGFVRVDDPLLMQDGYPIDPSAEGSVSFDYELCIREENVDPGDVLTISADMFIGPDGIASEDVTVWDYNDIDGDSITENDMEFTVPEDGVPDDLRVSFTIQTQDAPLLAFEGDALPSLKALADIARDGSIWDGGSSVVEPCANNETPRWGGYGIGTLASDSQPQMHWGLDIDHALPEYATFESGGWDNFSSAADGFAGMYFWKNASQAGGNARVVRYQEDGIDSDFNNGVGYFEGPTDADGYLEMGSYGTDGTKFASLARTSSAAWTLTLGSKTNAGPAVTNTVTKKALAKLCSSGFSPAWLYLVSAPTTDPLLYLYCGKGSTYRPVIAKWAANKVTAIAALGKPTTKSTCVVPTFGMDTRATGTEAAVVIYTRTSKRNSDGYCVSGGAVSNRSMMTISAAGVGSAVSAMADPWEGGDEPAYIMLAAGETPGSWIGVTYNSNGDMWSPATIGRPFTLDVAGFDLLADEVFLDPSTDFGYWANVTPIAEIGPNTWTVAVKGSSTIDGDNVSRVTLGTLNTDTGQITNGDIGESSDYGYSTSRHIDQIAADSEGNMTWYFNTADDVYTTLYWTLPVG